MNLPKLTAFTVRAAHDGVDTEGYRLRVNGALAQTRPVSELAGGGIAFPFPGGVDKGSYDLQVVAFNAEGESEPRGTILVVVGGVPAPVVSVTVVVIP